MNCERKSETIPTYLIPDFMVSFSHLNINSDFDWWMSEVIPPKLLTFGTTETRALHVILLWFHWAAGFVTS